MRFERLIPVSLAGALLAAGVLVGAQHGFAGVVTATVAVLLVLAVAVDLTAAPAPAVVRSRAVQRRALATTAVRQRDPDSAGRARPRAPSAA